MRLPHSPKGQPGLSLPARQDKKNWSDINSLFLLSLFLHHHHHPEDSDFAYEYAALRLIHSCTLAGGRRLLFVGSSTIRTVNHGYARYALNCIPFSFLALSSAPNVALCWALNRSLHICCCAVSYQTILNSCTFLGLVLVLSLPRAISGSLSSLSNILAWAFSPQDSLGGVAWRLRGRIIYIVSLGGGGSCLFHHEIHPGSFPSFPFFFPEDRGLSQSQSQYVSAVASAVLRPRTGPQESFLDERWNQRYQEHIIPPCCPSINPCARRR